MQTISFLVIIRVIYVNKNCAVEIKSESERFSGRVLLFNGPPAANKKYIYKAIRTGYPAGAALRVIPPKSEKMSLRE